jgi:hypothetical protein
MPERRSSRSLRDVSHLFLSQSRPARSAGGAGMVRVWLAAADASPVRAHLAAGLAAALAREGMRVSLVEVCSNLPAIGYYFGMDGAEYLLPVLDRDALAGGSWNGVVEYRFSAGVAPLRACRFEEPARGAPQAIVAAFQYPHGGGAAPFLAALREISAGIAGDGAPDSGLPDAIVLAGGADNVPHLMACMAALERAHPRAACFLASNASARGAGTFERLPLPEDMRRSWPRRTPPAGPWFDELAGRMLQLVSMRRRGAAGCAAR